MSRAVRDERQTYKASPSLIDVTKGPAPLGCRHDIPIFSRIKQYGGDFCAASTSRSVPVRPDEREVSVAKLALALGLEGACAAAVRGVLDQLSRRQFARLTGRWPGRRAKR